jgi:hypothetical protein
VKKVKEDRRVQLLDGGLETVLNQSGVSSIKIVDLLFMPQIISNHIFLYVFDLKKGNTIVIDNMNTGGASLFKYKEKLSIMVRIQ